MLYSVTSLHFLFKVPGQADRVELSSIPNFHFAQFGFNRRWHVNIFFPYLGDAVSDGILKVFTDHIFLAAVEAVAPFDRMGFGGSYKGDQERFRNEQGHIYPGAFHLEHVHLENVVDRMRSIIQGNHDLAYFRDFFFDTWCSGIKAVCSEPIQDPRQGYAMLRELLQESLNDLEWGFIDDFNSFIDFAIEAIPERDEPILPVIGLPRTYTASTSNALLHRFFTPDGHDHPVQHVHRQDPFLHFAHIGGWAAYVSSGVPPNHLGCVSMQVYSKFKTRFYQYEPGKDRHGISLDAERIYNQRIKRFDSFCKHTLETAPSYHDGVRIEVRVQLFAFYRHHQEIQHILSETINVPDSICWVQTASIYPVWRALHQGLAWAVENMDHGSEHNNLSFARRASVACFLASHVSGWFSRPDDNHNGWRQVYRILNETRAPGSSFMVNRRVFTFTAFDTLTVRRVLDNDVLARLLPESFVEIERYPGAQSISRRRRAVRTINATVSIAPPPPRINAPPEYQETLQNMTREINLLDENKRNWRPFKELRTQLSWFGVCSMQEFAQKLVFAYLRGSAQMATTLLGSAIVDSTAKYFERHINPAFLASKELLQNILPAANTYYGRQRSGVNSVAEYLALRVFQPVDQLNNASVVADVDLGQNYYHLKESRMAYIITIRALKASGKHEDAERLYNAIMEVLAPLKVIFMQDDHKCVNKEVRDRVPMIKFIAF
ncbi:predicted protein [Lichtheimia corymbifera JMRC:FSU:9682]|uniref:Uncharacterized protein n=1 Tax=Lichtheimia corymbifera JMRC:FSU:9682 TaxID=1263082 RepID=A0A068SIY5_9FUNG|nr:predicted protein [Lichtheimia corymbifera JMRC:FSU:9682]